MAKYFGIAILGLALMGPGADSVQGQDNTLAEVYSRGVQAYFNGEHEKSHQFLTQAISLNSPDPRCYYFRGLANTKLGRPEDAAVDFKKGATLEALDAAEFYPVSKSLIRIQGSARLAIETVRRQAKVDLKGLREERRRIRYEQLEAIYGQHPDFLRSVTERISKCPTFAGCQQLPEDLPGSAEPPSSPTC